MRIHHMITLIAALAVTTSTLGAQSSDTAKKPGGLNKVAHQVSAASKATGTGAKSDVHSVAAATHATLTKAGNDTKAQLKRTTGITSKTPDSTHKAGGVNKVARDVSHTSKTAGAAVKSDVKATGAAVHKAATNTGNAVKAAAKKVIKPDSSKH